MWDLISEIAAVNISFLHVLDIQPDDGYLASQNM